MPDSPNLLDDDDLFADTPAAISGTFAPGPEHDAAVTAALYQRAVGTVVWSEKVDRGEVVRLREQLPPDVAASKLWLQARDPEQWGERKQPALQVVVVRIEGKPESARSVIEHEPVTLLE